MTTSLEHIIKDRIRAAGPMDMATYMRLCLTHPDHGYYTTRENVIGQMGDFTTAPEISQLFGEMIGFFVADVWGQMGKPPVALCELGPGRGTLMADMLRILSRIPRFKAAVQIHLVEVSDVLIGHQAQALNGYDVTWHDCIEDLPSDRVVIIVNNEFFDALPVRQYARDGGGWTEIVVGLESNELKLGKIPCHPGRPQGDPGPLSELKSEEGPGSRLWRARDDTFLEPSPDRDAAADALYQKIKTQGGAVLTIDYGYDTRPGASTVQAVKNHVNVPVLHAPGNVTSPHWWILRVWPNARVRGD
jgi:NADH dehydrogenase [ubiquinone] 1 alpha subcomplex assembly factor 7